MTEGNDDGPFAAPAYGTGADYCLPTTSDKVPDGNDLTCCTHSDSFGPGCMLVPFEYVRGSLETVDRS